MANHSEISMLQDQTLLHQVYSAKLTAISVDQVNKIRVHDSKIMDVMKIKTRANYECDILTYQLEHAKQLIEKFKEEHKSLNDEYDQLREDHKENCATLDKLRAEYTRNRI